MARYLTHKKRRKKQFRAYPRCIGEVLAMPSSRSRRRKFYQKQANRLLRHGNSVYWNGDYKKFYNVKRSLD